MKRIMALAAIVSVLALFVLTGQASAQDGPSLTADPPAVDGPGTYTFTLTGSGWSAGLIVFIVPCTVAGEQLTTASSTDEIVAALSGMGQDDCVLAPLSAPTPVGADGTFTVEVTHDVPANFAFGAGDAGGTEESAAPILFIADDMDGDMDDMDGDMDDMDGDMGDMDGDMGDMDDMDGDMDDMDDMDGDMGDMDGDMGDMDGDMDDMGDMGDDMAPEGAAETGLGGMAGSDGNSVAVPLAATLAAVVLLGGAALVTRRHA